MTVYIHMIMCNSLDDNINTYICFIWYNMIMPYAWLYYTPDNVVHVIYVQQPWRQHQHIHVIYMIQYDYAIHMICMIHYHYAIHMIMLYTWLCRTRDLCATALMTTPTHTYDLYDTIWLCHTYDYIIHMIMSYTRFMRLKMIMSYLWLCATGWATTIIHTCDLYDTIS
jgi:hypothetical protein